MNRKRASLGGALAIAVAAVVVTLVAGGAAEAHTSKASGSSVSITVWTAVGPDYDWQKAQLAGFTKKTGIKVHYDSFPEASFGDKLTTAQQAKSSSFDVYEYPQSMTSQYLAYHGALSINSALKSAPKSWDRAGIPAGETGQCTIAGQTYCLPVQLDGGPQMFYNKAEFKTAGIAKPPSSWAQVVADAGKLTTGSQSGFCARGSETAPNGYPVLLMLPYYLPYAKNYKGEYLNASWKPLFDTPGALKWAGAYTTLMTKDAPNGVGAYDYTDCEHAFQTGQVAMWWDDASLGPQLWDPKLSKTAKDAGFDEIPCPAYNQTCLLSAPWGMFINPQINSTQQNAAWQYLQYMTSPSVQLAAYKATNNPDVATRPNTLTYAIAHASKSKIPADYLAALRYGIQHIEPNAIPVTAAFGAVQSQLFVILSDMISGQTQPADAVKSLQSQMTTTLKRYHLGK